MAEEKVFKNPSWFWSRYDHSTPGGGGRINIEDANGVNYFRFDEWDVEVKLTRKVKPIPNGTFSRRNDGGIMYYKNHGGRWMVSGTKVSAGNQDDQWYRENTKPLVTGEWDTV